MVANINNKYQTLDLLYLFCLKNQIEINKTDDDNDYTVFMYLY